MIIGIDIFVKGMHASETGIPACFFCNLLICNRFSYAGWIFNRHKLVFWLLLYELS